MQQQMPEELRNKFAQFQTLQQQLQMVSLQKQQFILEKSELEDSSKELEKAKGELYKSVGPILIKSSKTELSKELEDRLSSTTGKISLLEKQEQKLAAKFQELQKELQAALKASDAAA